MPATRWMITRMSLAISLSAVANAFLGSLPISSISSSCSQTQHQQLAAIVGSNSRIILHAEAPKPRGPPGSGGQGGASRPPGSRPPGSRPPFGSRPPGSRPPMRGRYQPREEVDPDRPPMNDVILRMAPNEVRVVISNPEGGDEMAGVMPTKDALEKAKEMGVDLIMISETADPPVVKVIDYGKFKYSQEKKKKEQKKKAKTTEVKEVKMSYKIENHDYGVRMKQMTRFIEDGDKVKVMIQFRGREQQHIDLGHELISKLGADLKDIATMEGDTRREGGRLMAMFKPKANK